MTDALFETQLDGFELIHRGKVRDMYAVDDEHLLIVTTDRLSAFDVILDQPIPGKGIVLTEVSNFWFQRFADVVPSHVSELALEDVVKDEHTRSHIAKRSVVVKRLRPLPIEAIVRGYIIGSGWKDYQANGAICGISLPVGLQLAEQLPEPIYTPSTKAAVGDHDENVDFAATAELIGQELAEQVRDVSLALYKQAAEYAATRGIIIADTKFEFGLDDKDQLCLIDEALTPDSSRFWPANAWQPGQNPPSFDKQFVRDWLENSGWNKKAPAPQLPAEILQRTADKYREAQRLLTQTG